MFRLRPSSFEWDEGKAEANLSKHGVSFMEASTVFFDGAARIVDDTRHSVDEDRFFIVGHSVRGRILAVSFCYRGEGTLIRIISAREATRTERGAYWRHLHAE